MKNTKKGVKDMFKKITMSKKIMVLFIAALLTMSFAGCSNKSAESKLNTTARSNNGNTDDSNTESGEDEVSELPDLEVRFGKESEPFTLHLYDNDTAAEIAKDIGSADWNLPIYHYDDYENYEVMQYYDIPSRYKIPSNPEKVTSEKAGEVYYSHPNRIILFYQDAEVTGEYTKVGYIDYSDELFDAVEDNPVIEGWGNKIVSISRTK